MLRKGIKKNECFIDISINSRDNYSAHLHKLKNVFHEMGIDLSTSNINKPDLSHAILQYGLKVKRLKNIDKKITILLP